MSNSNSWRRIVTAGDSQQCRLAAALAVALVVWALFLAQFVRMFGLSERAVTAPETIEMKLVEIVPPQPVSKIEPQPLAPPHAVAPVPAQPHRDTSKPARVAAPRPAQHEAVQAPKAPIVQQPNTPRPDEAAVAHAAPATAASTIGSTGSHDARDSSQAPSSAGSMQARLISQPLPVLPDDLREDAYRAEAVARFDVHPDGTTDVQLIKPTSNPRLNQILLEALHKWRFFPAMENGQPVESHRDVHVHFNVS